MSLKPCFHYLDSRNIGYMHKIMQWATYNMLIVTTSEPFKNYKEHLIFIIMISLNLLSCCH